MTRWNCGIRHGSGIFFKSAPYHLLTPGRELLTIITGTGAEPATTAALESWLDEHRPDVQVEIHKGGQPLYPYLFGVE